MSLERLLLLNATQHIRPPRTKTASLVQNKPGLQTGRAASCPLVSYGTRDAVAIPKGRDHKMFSVGQKREISEAVQRVLRETHHPELPKGEVVFSLHVDGAEGWSWADIRNNGAVQNPGVNRWNERQDRSGQPEEENDTT